SGGGVPRRAAGRAPRPDSRAHRGQATRQPRRRPARRPRPVPSRGRLALDRPHRGTTHRARGGGGAVNGTNGSAGAGPGGGGVIVEARDLVISFGETPALRGASV